MAVKRRVVWLTDEAWDAAERQAQRFLQTRSAYISALIIGGRVVPPSVQESADAIEARPNLLRMTQAERDAVLRRVNRGKS